MYAEVQSGLCDNNAVNVVYLTCVLCSAGLTWQGGSDTTIGIGRSLLSWRSVTTKHFQNHPTSHDPTSNFCWTGPACKSGEDSDGYMPACPPFACSAGCGRGLMQGHGLSSV
jgi:hypothetical protein